MQNVHADPAYAGTVTQLGEELARLRVEVGDTDEGFPELREIAER